MEQEGITFRYGEAVTSIAMLSQQQFSAIILATGTPVARDLKVPGRELKGVHLALELLSLQNRVLAGMEFSKEERITAKGKDVLVIGGGDTGSDCIGTAHRQGCKSVTQIEILLRLGPTGLSFSRRPAATKKVVHVVGTSIPSSSSERMER